MIRQALGEGIRLTHKNWKVIPYQLIVLCVLIFFSFFLLVIPLFLTFNMLSIDLEQLANFFKTRTYPINVVEKYLKLAGIIAINSFFYSTYCMLTLFIVIGGTLRTLKNSLEIKNYEVNFITFLKEGGASILPLWGLMSAALTGVLLVFLLCFPLLQMAFDKISPLLEDQSSSLYTQFFNTFTSFFMTLVPLFVFFFIVTIGVYSAVGTVVSGKGIFKSLGNSFNLFEKRPFVMSLFAFLVLFFIAANISAVIISLSQSIFSSEGNALLFGIYSLLYYFIVCYVFTLITGSVLSSYLRLSSPR